MGFRTHRLPILLKDIIDATPIYTSAGLGKTGLSEFANSFGNQPSGFSNLTGQVLNANDADQNPSGSSSGSGAAAAASLSMLTIGTGTSGSIISPSSAEGIVDLRPTVGLDVCQHPRNTALSVGGYCFYSMELRDLRTFATVLELRGMTRAARRLHVVQSAVSQAIKRLEQEYGLQLLERRSDGVYPTTAGIELGRHAQRILDGVARLEEDMASYRGHSKGVANVGVVSTLAATLVAPLVRAVDQELPDVKLHVKEGVAGELLEGLRLARLDLVAVVSPVEVEDLTFVSTGELDLYFIVPPGHPFADREQIAFAEAADELWISFPPSNPGRRWLDDNSRKAGFRPLIAAEIETFTQMKAFVEAGHGITVAPRELVPQELELGVLVAVLAVDPAAKVGLGYVFDERQARPTVAAVRPVLEEQLRELISVVQRA